MSNDEKSRPSGERKTTAPLALTRRGLMKLVGAGIAVAAFPDLTACTTEVAPPPDDDKLLASAKWVGVGRRDDLVILTLGIIGLDVMDAGKTPPPAGLTLKGSLYLGRTSGPAYLLVDHPPQHILEESFDEPPAGGSVPTAGETVQHRIARKSRLSFFVPDAVLAIPYELDAILAALSTLQLHVAPNAWDEPPGATLVYTPQFELAPLVGASAAAALPPATRIKLALRAARAQKSRLSFRARNPESTTREAVVPGLRTMDVILRKGPVLPQPPDGLQTQIELPFRLIVSPNSHATWQHAPSPVVSKTGRVELWHTRMTTPEGWQKTIRALATRDKGFDAGDASSPKLEQGPFKATLKAIDRADIVHVTTNYTLRDDAGLTLARAVDVDTLMLSSLGGWLDSHGAWQHGPKDPNLAAWDHRATMGRDQYVRIARYGALYPFGHAAMLIEVSERKLLPGFEDTAYLWTHRFIVVKEPLKTYDFADPSFSRGFPFKSLRFKTLVTPNLDAGSPILGTSASQWALVGGKAFPFEVEAFDHDGNVHAFTTACIWASDKDQGSAWGTTKTAFEGEWRDADGGARRVNAMKSQRVALAPSDDLDDTTYTTQSMTHHAKDAPPGNSVPFVPQLEVATLAVDTVRAMTGKDVATSFRYLGKYVEQGFDDAASSVKNNLSGAFMTLSDATDTTAQLLLSGGEVCGGVAQGGQRCRELLR